ncbi:MAG: methyltransferase domain-containing protein [Acidiferrobacterales bacterium]
MSDDKDLSRQWWDNRYADDHIPWDRQGVSPALYHWLEAGTLTPGRILVPGCGRGHEVVELTRCGFDVTAVDIAPAAIAFLQQRLFEQRLHADVQQVDLFALDPDGTYDAIYDQTSLCAMVPSQWPDYERRLHRWLHSDGQLFILFMQTERPGGPPFHCDLSEMRRLFSEARWYWSDEPPLKVPHSVGFVEQGCVLGRKN